MKMRVLPELRTAREAWMACSAASEREAGIGAVVGDEEGEEEGEGGGRVARGGGE